VNYLEALDHPQVFGHIFAGDSWRSWRVIEKSIFGLDLDDDELPLFKQFTGREQPLDRPAREAWIIAGRRSAKSRKAATIGVFLCTIGAEVLSFRKALAPGETGTCLIMAVDKRQAQVVLGYARALFRHVPMLGALVDRDTGDGVELTNGMALTVLANDFRSIRGRTLIAVIMDECAYWRHELTTSPDLEVYRAARPGLASVPGSLLIAISSPYRRAGLLWRKYRKHWAQPGDVLVVRAETRQLNPEIDQQIVAEALEDDPEAGRAEWLAEFRADLADFVPRQVVESLVSRGVYERPPIRGQVYHAFTDPSGGTSDAFTLGICHREGEVAVLDVLRERRPPFSPEAVVEEYTRALHSYGVRQVVGDKYAGEWPREQFRKRGIWYRPADLPKSQIYLECLPLLNGGRIDLLDDERMINQISSLERRTARAGKDSVDHPPHAHDDLANSALGAAWLAAGKAAPTLTQRRMLGV
jgi:hypothetical protein